MFCITSTRLTETHTWKTAFYMKQDANDDFSVCVLNLLPKVNTLPSLVVMTLAKVKTLIFLTVTWLHVGHLIKGSCGFMFCSLLHQVSTLPSLVSIHLLQVKICISFVKWLWKVSPLICHVNLWVGAPCGMSIPWEVWWT